MDWRPGLLVTKDPDSILDYQWDFSEWLALSETINSSDVDAETGITVDSSSTDVSSVTVWLSGGTAGEKYTVRVRAVTNQGRTVDRSVDFLVAEQ